jgi:hypothetical protein
MFPCQENAYKGVPFACLDVFLSSVRRLALRMSIVNIAVRLRDRNIVQSTCTGTRKESKAKAKASRHPSPPSFPIVQPSPAQPTQISGAEYREVPYSSYLRTVSSLPRFINDDDDTGNLI